MRRRLNMQFGRHILHQARNFSKTPIQRTLPPWWALMLKSAFPLGLIGNNHFSHRLTGSKVNVEATHDDLLIM